MRRHPPGWVFFPAVPVLLLLFVVCPSGCSQDTAPAVYKNQPPTVWIAAGPVEGSVADGYRVGFEWGGWDPDGRIAHYEYCITDNNGAFDPDDTTGAGKWNRTTKTADVFEFTADEPVDTAGDDLAAEFRRSHTFFIRSVDDAGVPSPSPAHRSFTARTLSPDVFVDVPRGTGIDPAPIPPIATFEWTATDYVEDLASPQEPEAVSWILEPVSAHGGGWGDWQATIDWIRDLPVESDRWGDWVDYGEPGGDGRHWTTPPLARDGYVFAIRARDEAGAITPVFDEARNVRRVVVRLDGYPLLRLYSPIFGGVATATLTTPLTIVDVPAGVPIEMEWSATADHYGGQIVGYRYGWDVADPQDPAQWSVDWTPFVDQDPDGAPYARLPEPREYFFGTHVFSVEVRDNSGFRSRIEVKINIVPFPMTQSLLLVDDFDEGGTGGWDHPVGMGVLPSDAEHDAYWETVLSDVDGFLPAADVIEAFGGQTLPLTGLANYRSIVWSVFAHVDQTAGYPKLYDLVAFRPGDDTIPGGGKRATNLLALYLAAGGRLLLCGQHPVSMGINDTCAPGVRFPVMFEHELDLREHDQSVPPDPANPTGHESFAWRDLCLEALDFAYTDPGRWRTMRLVCPERLRNNPPQPEREITMRAAIPLDPAFPRLELRPETAGPGKWYDPLERGLDAELYNPSYFLHTCVYVPSLPRPCFEPIYGLECLNPAVQGFGQPVAFWTSVHAGVTGPAPGVLARSAVFGFPPVLFDPDAGRTAIGHVLFDEWGLPRR